MKNTNLELETLTHHYAVPNQTEGKSPRTVEWYTGALNLFRDWLVAEGMSTSVDDLGEDEVRQFILYIQGRKGLWGKASSYTLGLSWDLASWNCRCTIRCGLPSRPALLDNLCQGRLIVGTAKGSNYSAYEYIGFGSNPGLGVEQMEEAEELLVKAWTTDNLEFKGRYYQVSFPSVRPRPYQKPHPWLARACLNEESIKEMGRIGRPILLRGRSTNSTAAHVRLYREAMQEDGFDPAVIGRNLDQIWVWREMHLAATDEQALAEILLAQYDAFTRMEDTDPLEPNRAPGGA